MRGEPQRCGGLLSLLATDNRGLASRTCPRVDPIVRAIAHSCARDWAGLNFSNWTLCVLLGARCVFASYPRYARVAKRQHCVKTGTCPTIYWTEPNRWLDIGSAGGGSICCLDAQASLVCPRWCLVLKQHLSTSLTILITPGQCVGYKGMSTEWQRSPALCLCGADIATTLD